MDNQIQSEALVERELDTDAARARKEILEKELERYLRVLIEEEDPELILLFGSMVTGEIHESADIDLVVVQDSDQPFLPRTREMRRILNLQIGTDLLWYTPDEFNHMFHNRLFFKQEIVGKGKVLYERGNNTLDRLCQRRYPDALPGMLPDGPPSLADARSALLLARQVYDRAVTELNILAYSNNEPNDA